MKKNLFSSKPLSWQVSAIQDLDVNRFIKQYSTELHSITIDGFNDDIEFSSESIENTLFGSTHVLLLKDKRGLIFGFAFVLVKDSFTYINKICIKKSAQGIGMTDHLLCKLIDELKIDTLSCATQNPNLINAIHKRVAIISPINVTYDTKIFRIGINEIIKIVPQLRDRNICPKTGIIKKLYGKTLGNISYSENARNIMEKMKAFGFDKVSGDSMLITGYKF